MMRGLKAGIVGLDCDDGVGVQAQPFEQDRIHMLGRFEALFAVAHVEKAEHCLLVALAQHCENFAVVIIDDAGLALDEGGLFFAPCQQVARVVEKRIGLGFLDVDGERVVVVRHGQIGFV